MTLENARQIDTKISFPDSNSETAVFTEELALNAANAFNKLHPLFPIALLSKATKLSAKQDLRQQIQKTALNEEILRAGLVAWAEFEKCITSIPQKGRLNNLLNKISSYRHTAEALRQAQTPEEIRTVPNLRRSGEVASVPIGISDYTANFLFIMSRPAIKSVK